jgi:hypothetical protein
MFYFTFKELGAAQAGWVSDRSTETRVIMKAELWSQHYTNIN